VPPDYSLMNCFDISQLYIQKRIITEIREAK
jgi:hypothetical protein